MAKYMVKFSCGHEQEVSLFGKTSERERKIAWYENYGLCSECYKVKARETDASQGLTLNASVLPDISDEGEILIYLWFSGDTMSHKDDIKRLGYRWGTRRNAKDFFSVDSVKCWYGVIEAKNFGKELERAEAIGAQYFESEKGLFADIHYQIALKKRQAWLEVNKEIEQIEKPEMPWFLAEQLEGGRRWNQTVYGKRSGSYAIYIDGEKILLSDDQAEEIQEYLSLKEKYAEKVSMIKKENAYCKKT